MAQHNPLAAVNRHIEAMGTRDTETILSGYTEDAVVLTNLATAPIVGREGLRELFALHKKIEDAVKTTQPNEILLQCAAGEYALHVFQNKEAQCIGIETYRVPEDKIAFEAAYLHFYGENSPGAALLPKQAAVDLRNPTGDAALEALNRHGRMMSTNDKDIIAKDYADNAMIISNLAEPAIGKAAITALIAQSLVREEDVANPTVPNENVMQLSDGKNALHVFKNDTYRFLGVEIYIVQNDKIDVESVYIHRW